MRPFELHHVRKARTESNNIVIANESNLSDWKTMNVSLPPKQIPNNVARNEKREITDHMKMTWKKVPCSSSHKSPERKPIRPVSGNFQYLFKILERGSQKKSPEEKYEEQPKIAFDGTKHTVRTTEKKITPELNINVAFKFRDHQRKMFYKKSRT